MGPLVFFVHYQLALPADLLLLPRGLDLSVFLELSLEKLVIEELVVLKLHLAEGELLLQRVLHRKVVLARRHELAVTFLCTFLVISSFVKAGDSLLLQLLQLLN